MTCEYFDLEQVLHPFKASLKDEDDIFLDEYLKGYDEINKFFQLMGTVFGFVGSDVRSKVAILADFRRGENKENFLTLKTMLDFEKSSGLLADKSYVSGSRTLLRLHRGLEFIHKFLLLVSELSEKDNTSSCCQVAYNSTLAKYHPWVVRKGAVVAMYALPTQGELLKRVCADVPRAIEVLPEMLKITKIVHERTEDLYTTFDLHSLP